MKIVLVMNSTSNYLATNDVGDSNAACAIASSSLGGNVKFNLFFVILILLILINTTDYLSKYDMRILWK